jgi:hypothetical protein
VLRCLQKIIPTEVEPWWFARSNPIVERLYCKRPILCLASSKILTPHPPHSPASVRVRKHSLGGEGGGGSIVWKTPDTALCSTCISTLWTLCNKMEVTQFSFVYSYVVIYKFCLLSRFPAHVYQRLETGDPGDWRYCTVWDIGIF